MLITTIIIKVIITIDFFIYKLLIPLENCFEANYLKSEIRYQKLLKSQKSQLVYGRLSILGKV